MAAGINGSIALIRSSFSPYGGAETIALEVIRALLSRSLNILLLTTRGHAWPIEHPNLKVVSLRIWRTNRLIEAWSFDREVRRYLSRDRFDRILSIDRVSRFTHLHAGGGTHKSFLAAKNRNASFLERLFRQSSLFHRYVLNLEMRGFRNPLLKSVHCCSNMVAEDIRRDYGVAKEQLQVIYNPVQWTRMGSIFSVREKTAEILSRKEGIDPGARWLLFLGSGFRRKGIDLALEGLCSLSNRYKILVVGAGDEKKVMKLADELGIRHRLCALGPRPDGWRYAALCCGLVLPSSYEPFGLAAAEAQTMGLPVLVSKATGFSELVRDGENGIILSENSPTAARDAFQRFARLIERPHMTADEIRNGVRMLDTPVFMEKLAHQFLEIGSLLSG